MNEKRLHIAFSFDKNYINQAVVFIESIIDNHQTPITFHSIVGSNVTQEIILKIKQTIEARGHLFYTYPVNDKLLEQYTTSGTWSHAVYYKLFFPVLVDSSVQRLLFLDVDAVVLKSLDDLYSTELSGKALAAVYDNYVKTQPLIGITTENMYFNSGMMLIDIPVWNEKKLTEKAISYLSSHPENIRFVDQCALNAVVLGEFIKLEPKYNFTFSYVQEFREQFGWKHTRNYPHFVHYTLQRPWNFLCANPFRYAYRKYFRKSAMTRGNAVQDFRWSNVPAFIKLRITELYLNSEILIRFWRKLKLKK